MNSGSLNKTYYPALDGLRGLAILLVVLHHNFKFMNLFFFGWLGVDLFFVLSGFLITDILLSTINNPNFLRNFYLRRVLRIFPLYYLILIICLFILPIIKNLHLDIGYYSSNQFWQWIYLQNWLYVFKEPYGTPILLHTWSLAVEEQFYLVWPITIFLIRKPKILLTIAVLVLLAAGFVRYVIWVDKIENLAYSTLYTFTRIDGLCIGSMIALLIRINPELLKKYKSAIVLLMAVFNFGFYFLNIWHSFTIPYLAIVGYTTFAVVFGIILHEAIIGKSKIIQLVFDNHFMKFFGKISYGLYVYHWPINILFFPFFQNLLIKKFASSVILAEAGSAIIISIISILLSVLSYYYFERFFLKFKTRYV